MQTVRRQRGRRTWTRDPDLPTVHPREYLAYRAGAAADYAAQMIELAGMEPAQPTRRPTATWPRCVPLDGPLETHRFTVLEEHGERVGIVWVGPGRMDGSAAWIYDVAVEERHRGRGFGRALMLEAERASREAGDPKLGLNVFGGNVNAIGLYLEPGLHRGGPADEQVARRGLTSGQPLGGASAREEPYEGVFQVQVLGLRALRDQVVGRGEEGSYVVVGTPRAARDPTVTTAPGR